MLKCPCASGRPNRDLLERLSSTHGEYFGGKALETQTHYRCTVWTALILWALLFGGGAAVWLVTTHRL